VICINDVKSLKKALSNQGFFHYFFVILLVSKYFIMKGSYLFFVFMLIIALEALSQESVTPNLPVDPESKKILYREVVEEPGTPGYLYEKAIEWFGYYYINAQSVYSIQHRNSRT
jgi:hypothetical protein